MSDSERQAWERDALCSMYGDAIVCTDTGVRVTVRGVVLVHVSLPRDYPSASRPSFHLTAAGPLPRHVLEDVQRCVAARLAEEPLGAECVMQLVQGVEVELDAVCAPPVPRCPPCSNMYAPLLKDDEMVAMKADPEMGRRVIQSYRLMLDFCGLVLLNEATGASLRSAMGCE